MLMHLITTFYQPRSIERRLELDRCLVRNLKSRHVSHVHLFVDDAAAQRRATEIATDIGAANKTAFVRVGVGPPSYKDLFMCAMSLPPNTECMIANADVYLFRRGLIPKRTALCLSRHEWDFSCPIIANGTLSHDAFVFTTPLPRLDLDRLPPRQNIAGAENVTANVLYTAGLALRNPCKTWIIVHEHASALRTYDETPDAHLLNQERARRGKPLVPQEWGAFPEV